MTSALHRALLNFLIHMKPTKGHAHINSPKCSGKRVFFVDRLGPYNHFSCCGSYLKKEGIKAVHFHCVSHGNFNTNPHARTDFMHYSTFIEFEVIKRGFLWTFIPFLSRPASPLTCLKQRQSRKTRCISDR